MTPKSNIKCIFNEFVLKDKSIKSLICYVVSENTLVEKYQVAIFFPWNSERLWMLSGDLITMLGLYLKPSITHDYVTLLYYWFENACMQAQAVTRVNKLLGASTENQKMGIIN